MENNGWYINDLYFLENIIAEKSFKKFYDNFYIIPKELKYKKEEIKILRKMSLNLEDDILEDIYIIKRGVKCHKLSEEKVNEIKRMLHNSECNQTEIAKKFNVSKATITKIKQGKYYR